MTPLDLDALVRDPGCRILLVTGAGGVGKTTIAASLAVCAAEAGRHVVVLTIDPARRLATTLGLAELGNEPQPVPGIDAAAGGSLDAMMLDMARTFDDAVRAAAGPERAAELLGNPFYEAVAREFSGTQEYMAMEKLGELVEAGAQRWDLIVVDTPPSTSALDFLDGPRRLQALFDSPALRMLALPTRGSLKFLGLGVQAVNAVLDQLLGRRSLADLQTFVLAFEQLLGGFRDRARATRERLSQPTTACLVVATAEAEPLREADDLLARLVDEDIVAAGLLANRVEPAWGEGVPQIEDELDDDELGRWTAAALAAARARRRDQLRRVARAAGTMPVAVVERTREEPVELAALRNLTAANG